MFMGSRLEHWGGEESPSRLVLGGAILGAHSPVVLDGFEALMRTMMVLPCGASSHLSLLFFCSLFHSCDVPLSCFIIYFIYVRKRWLRTQMKGPGIVFALVCFRIGIGSVGNRGRRKLTVEEHVLGYVLNQALRECRMEAGCHSWIMRPGKLSAAGWDLRSPLTV